MTSLLNQDFGSESEDDDFNPAPAEDSGNEAGSDAEPSMNGKGSLQSSKARTNGDLTNGQSASKSSKTPKEEDEDEDEADADDAAGGKDNDEDDEEDEEDEEEAISVSRPCPPCRSF